MLRILKSLSQILRDLLESFKVMDIKDKTIIVVGATGGIGQVLCQVFHNLGANVVLAARTEEKLEKLEEKLGGNRVMSVKTDASSLEDVTFLFEKSRSRFGKIHAVVTAAGTWKRLSIENSPEEALGSIQLMVDSVFLPSYLVGFVAQEFFRKQGFGLIANISSHAAIRPWLKGNLSYGAMKAASTHFMLGIASALDGTSVRVLDIQPAIVNTPEAAELLATEENKRKAVQPEAIARLIAENIGKTKVPTQVVLDSDVKLD